MTPLYRLPQDEEQFIILQQPLCHPGFREQCSKNHLTKRAD